MTELAALRQRAFDVGYRMTGSHADADDIAQETLLRVREPLERGEVRVPEAFTTTIATRLAIDRARSAHARREQYVGPWLPEPIVEWPDDDSDRADTISYALLVVLETLGPVERAAFLLHDVFAYSYPEIARALDRTEPASRQLVTRARRRVADGRLRLDVDRDVHRELVERFLDAASGADVDGLSAMLSGDAQLVSDGGADRKAARHPIVGRERVVRFVASVLPRFLIGGEVVPVDVNGAPGFVITHDGATTLAATVDVAQHQIVAVRWVINPDKLTNLQLRTPR